MFSTFLKNAVHRAITFSLLIGATAAFARPEPVAVEKGPEAARHPAAGTEYTARWVYFSRMDIDDCKEFGSCDWQLDCRLGDTQNTRLLDMAEADTGESLPIGRWLNHSRDTFPLIVECDVREYDGGIGAGWEWVGTSQVYANAPGWYSMRMSNSEGTVNVPLYVY